MLQKAGVIPTILILSALAPVAVGQAITGDLVVNVTDPSGAVIAAAKLILTEVETNLKQELPTDPLGNASFSNLKPGLYKLDVTQSGFQAQSITDVRVQVGQRARVDVKLAVG